MTDSRTVRVSADIEVFCDRGGDAEPTVHAGTWPLRSLRATCEHGSSVAFDLEPIEKAIDEGKSVLTVSKDATCIEDRAPYREHRMVGIATVTLQYGDAV